MTTTAAPDESRNGGSLRIHADVNSPFNPFLFQETEIGPVNPFSGLVRPALFAGVSRVEGIGGEVVPGLVTEIPTLANGGLTSNDDGSLTVRYEIDPDAVWSDGVPVSGDDFAFTYEFMSSLNAQLTDEGAQSPATWPVCDAPAPLSGVDPVFFAGIDPDSLRSGPKWFEYTVVDRPDDWYFLFETVVPKHAVDGSDYVMDWLDRAWPSAGPFEVASIDRSSGEVVLERNDRYWRKDPGTGAALPYLDRIVIEPPANAFLDVLPDEYAEAFLAVTKGCPREVIFEALGADMESEAGSSRFAEFEEALALAAVALYEEGEILDLSLGEVYGTGQSLASYIPMIESGTVVSPRTREWEHIGFNYADARLRRNPDSLIEHLEFRQAIAYAIDRDRIAAEASAVPTQAMDSIIETYSPTLGGEGWGIYEHNPERARELVESLCQRLGRDCDADPPTLAFTQSLVRPQESGTIARLLTEMLGEVGIEVDVTVENLWDALGCPGWEAVDFSWIGGQHWAGIADIFSILDPDASAFLFDPASNLYQWGTEPFVSEGFEDDPSTEGCDESTLYDVGPSSVRDEFTRRYAELLDQVDQVVDPAEYPALINELESILADQVVIIPLYLATYLTAVRDDIVAGLGAGTVDLSPFWNVDRWYLKQPQPGA